ncbi:hypothetical protein [uncultured Roseivirga sp.]|uniref:hypothetical protein n=1 Tax=uncultured Roseivirga sp. TaxID=543088 RepID=UPI000D78EAFF|nr:hypothetical protein [uncultured Roseivirga sp.]PWL28537.1 MAG: hypothetical protein DCO95_14340 [Roseivirga sp. XM-24bin3]
MISKKEQSIIENYLKEIGISHYEPFEELLDHIATSYEQSQASDVKHFIDKQIQPSFGGVKGILKIVKEQNKTRRNFICKRAATIFLSLLKWPMIILTGLMFFAMKWSLEIFDPKTVSLSILTLSIFIPMLIAFYGQIKFYYSCKKESKAYTSSNTNLWLFQMMHLPSALLNLLLNLVITQIVGKESFWIEISNYPWILAAILTFFLMYFYTFLKLYQEKFIFKITHVTY